MSHDARAGALLGAALDTYRRHPARVLGSAAVVFGLGGVFDTAVIELTDPTRPGALLLVILGVGLVSFSTLGVTFYAGLLDRIVGEELRGEPRLTMGEVVRTLPYGRLLVADLLVFAVAGLGFLLLVVPGFILYTLFAIVGPVINVEGRGPIGALRRSATLVWPRFWLVLVMVTVPVTVEHEITAAVHVAVDELHVVLAFLGHALVGITIGSFVGLVEVHLAHRLMLGDEAAARSPITRSG